MLKDFKSDYLLFRYMKNDGRKVPDVFETALFIQRYLKKKGRFRSTAREGFS